MMGRTLLLFMVAMATMTPSIHGDQVPATQVLVFRDLPEDVRNLPVHMIIRSTYKGTVEFIESDEFQVQVNVTAPDTHELARVHFNYTDYLSSALLQVYEREPAVVVSPIKFILLAIGGIAVLAFLLSILFVLWWNAYKRPYIKETKIFHPDSSQAPLLDSKQGSEGEGSSGSVRGKKKKKRKPSKTLTSEEYVSSEDDNLDRPENAQSPNRKPQYCSPHKIPPPESDLVATAKHGAPAAVVGTEGMTLVKTIPSAVVTPEGTLEKPVVSYIKMQQSDAKKKGAQYVPLSQSEGSGSDIEKQSTLKIRRDDCINSQTMPDVIRRNRPVEQPGPKGGTQYMRLQSTEPDSSDNEYHNMGRLTGAHIAQILQDRNRGSPKFSHNTDKIPTTFGPPYNTLPNPKKDRDLDQTELDSVGSSRSGESSKSSGFKTQTGSYTDSLRSDIDKRPFSDSDSAKSSLSSTNTFPRSSCSDYSGGYGKLGPPSRQSVQPVDEAYGTMGSTSSGSTTRSGSNASTGSGSSGSVITVVAADENGTFKRRRFPTKDDVQQPPQGGTLGRRGPGSGAFPGSQKYLHMTVVCSLCLVSLITGVYCQVVTETTVHIKVFAPSGYIRNGSEVFFSKGIDGTVLTNRMKAPLHIKQYEVRNAQLLQVSPGSQACSRTSCAQGCDPNTGDCICPHGYKISDGYHCDDIDECTEMPVVCDRNAQCFNTPGTYQCMCTEGYYNNGKDCLACEAPCPLGRYEVLPCSGSHAKLCEACAKSCSEEYYISKPCNDKENTGCSECTPRCTKGKYEYTPCHGKQNRQCRDVAELETPEVTNNIVYEDRQKAKQVFSYLLHQTTSTGPLTHMLELKRGNGFSVHITLKESNLAPLYEAVDHRDSNDNTGFYGDMSIKELYCPYPVPEKYQLSLVMHKDITTRAHHYNCNDQNSAADTCEKETGYYLNPREPCETYSHFGRLPALNPEGWSILCAEPGRLSDLFSVSAELDYVSTMFVDKTVRCAEQRTNCDACLVMCARTMQNRQGSHRCNITGEDADNGESPRLQHCFSCCGKQECSDDCSVYHDQQCEPVRCVTGNLAEFVLRPAFSNRGTVFGCHIEPKRNYKIYDIDYSVTKDGKPINGERNTVLKAVKMFDGNHPDKATESLVSASDLHNFLKVYYGSEMNSKLNFIEGDSAMRSFSAGYYIEQGMDVMEMDVTSRSLSVRPKTPFGVSTEYWKNQDCDTHSLNHLLLATSNPDSDPYRPDPQVNVQFVQAAQYRVFNRTSVPFIYFEVPKNQSLLKPFFPDTTVKDDSTLKAELERQEDQWLLHVQGELEKCPGFFSIRVSDPHYSDQLLFDYDIGVRCPKTFTLDFAMPTRGEDNYDKRMKMEIEDTYRKINLIVFRPAPNMTKETIEASMEYENKGESQMTIFTPIVAVLCVVVSFLALLLVVGFLTETGKPPKQLDNKVHSQHLLFVVCFATFRAAYSIAVTFTVLLLLIRFANKDSVSTVMEFHRFVETADNIQKIEVEKIQAFVSEELHRQNQLANLTKVQCEQKLQQLQNVLEETKQELRVESSEERLVSQVALQYTKLMILNLTNDIIKFKQEFSSYAQKAVERLKRSIVQTSSALLSNKWLAGAKVIYDVVQSKRASQGEPQKEFMDWLGIQQEMERLSVDLSLENFPMPNLTDFLSLQVPQTNNRQSSIPSINEINLPRNQWYFQFENKPNPSQPDAGSLRPKKIRLDTSKLIGWRTLLIMLVFVDILWFVHRMAKTYSTAKMILYGCPYYIDCKKTADSRSPQRANRRQHSQGNNKFLGFLKDLNLRVMKTEFIPKLVATATTCCAIYLVLKVSDHLLTAKTLASVGYFDSLVAPMDTSYRLARTRIKTNAYRINKFEYPFYEELVNVRTKRYQLMLEMYRDLQRSNNILHDSEYCAWKKMLQPNEACNCTSANTVKLHFEGCELPPVTPRAYERRDFNNQKDRLSAAMMPYINSGRQIVMDTSHLVLIFVSLLVLVDILGSVTWIYLKRFNLLRLKPLFEIEQCPDRSQT